MSTRLIFALHFHQPVGNFDHVFEQAVRDCYLPIVEHFQRHPGVQAAFHLSGCLLEWLEQRDRKFLDRVFGLVGRKQIEPMGGGFYEPILTVIPREDALEQIDRLSNYWVRNSGVKPAGIWLAERVWEPSLAELLSDAGVRYTILDDQHIRFAGLLDPHFSGLYVTERAGKAIGFFPSDYTLRYLIPFRTIETVQEHFERLSRESPNAAYTYGDDAEKFGLWPKTHAWVYGEQWLERFFSLLEKRESVEAISPGTYLESRPVARKVYVPNASYAEMLEWALPASSVPAYTDTVRAVREQRPEAVKAFVRGSLWDMFLARYPEADHMHKRVLRTSRRVRDLKEPLRSEALTAVLRAECNCAYWHGLFGGIYLPHLRQGVYQNVLAADALLAEARGSEISVDVEDFDGDLEPEIVLAGPHIQAFFKPSDGGTLTELDFLPARFNVANVISRWKESYHEAADVTHSHNHSGGVVSPHERPVGIDPERLKNWPFDAIPLRSFREFVSPSMPGGTFFEAPGTIDSAQGRLSEWRKEPKGWSGAGRVGNLSYRKEVQIEVPATLHVRLQPPPSAGDTRWFGTLLYFTLLTGDAPDRSARYRSSQGKSFQHPPGHPVEISDLEELVWEDNAFHFSMEIRSAPVARVVTRPILTIQRSEDRYESIYQGSALALAWPLGTLPKEGVEVKVSLRSKSG
ncbi:MAG TPA: alpha-amylase/4-alpha-glucanotransferase domain-containing protein [Bdellovibrionota bacterium]|nr:alpha-amylase/4-alpha-glucanotransferase domain-containing protein [Bdellovibrionota bacterium]